MPPSDATSSRRPCHTRDRPHDHGRCPGRAGSWVSRACRDSPLQLPRVPCHTQARGDLPPRRPPGCWRLQGTLGFPRRDPERVQPPLRREVLVYVEMPGSLNLFEAVAEPGGH